MWDGALVAWVGATTMGKAMVIVGAGCAPVAAGVAPSLLAVAGVPYATALGETGGVAGATALGGAQPSSATSTNGMQAIKIKPTGIGSRR